MKKVQKFYLKVWHLILAFIILGYSFAFLFIDSNIIFREDFAGHFQKAKNIDSFSLVQGWDTTSWAGYSQDLYPNLYHLYLKGFLLLFSVMQTVQISAIKESGAEVLGTIPSQYAAIVGSVAAQAPAMVGGC